MNNQRSDTEKVSLEEGTKIGIYELINERNDY